MQSPNFISPVIDTEILEDLASLSEMDPAGGNLNLNPQLQLSQLEYMQAVAQTPAVQLPSLRQILASSLYQPSTGTNSLSLSLPPSVSTEHTHLSPIKWGDPKLSVKIQPKFSQTNKKRSKGGPRNPGIVGNKGTNSHVTLQMEWNVQTRYKDAFKKSIGAAIRGCITMTLIYKANVPKHRLVDIENNKCNLDELLQCNVNPTTDTNNNNNTPSLRSSDNENNEQSENPSSDVEGIEEVVDDAIVNIQPNISVVGNTVLVNLKAEWNKDELKSQYNYKPSQQTVPLFIIKIGIAVNSKFYSIEMSPFYFISIQRCIVISRERANQKLDQRKGNCRIRKKTNQNVVQRRENSRKKRIVTNIRNTMIWKHHS